MVEKSERAQKEEKVLQFWKDNKIFEKSLEKPAPKGEFVFYEGPPTANGRPGIHHIEARSFKDAIPRYKTMQGYRVPRKGGWDTHGLPVELQVEKQLGLKSKKEIEEYGVARFNEECKKSVWEYVDEWTQFTDRMGYWIDIPNAYVTYHNSYIEALWSVLAHVEKRNLLYKDYKVVPWCPRCGTALSSHELAQGYQDVKDLSLYAKFKIKGFPNAYFLAWTTTPWTLPGNVALAVGENVTYVEAKVGEEIYVLAKDKLSLITQQYEIVAEHKGSEMVGMEYEPLYPFLADKSDKSFKVYTADFVNTEDGTGIVHTAVMYGQDDFVLGTKIGLPKHHLVSPDGTFMKGTDWLEGRSVVDETLAVDILKDLQNRNLLFGKENYSHSYPFCWRCKTRLIYYARDSWYIKMSELRDELVKENEKINWEPDYIKEGRFGEWLREVKDWAISRERYWGTPLPVWVNSDESKRLVVDSVDTLKKYSKKSGNKYFVMRHGEAENNVRRIVSSKVENQHHLSDKGREQVGQAAARLKEENIDLIIASPFVRTRETAEIAAEKLGLDKAGIIFDARLSEFNFGEFEGGSEDKAHEFLHSRNMFEECCPGGESFRETKKRVGEALYDAESKYSGKNILLVTHKISAWLLVSAGGSLDVEKSEALNYYLNNAEVREMDFVPLPHNDSFELDLHKPYIDKIVLEKNGEEYKRVKEVMDVWFDSGAMPFAQDPKNVLYPADFISEAIDQTRGWFYTLHAVGVLMERGRAYKNVISLGHILDKEGKKMSKSVGNVIDPWEMMDKYGVDVLRLWMYSVNQPGESKNFDERTVEEQKKMLNTLHNVYSFYELFRDKSLESAEKPNSNNVLDKWIFKRLMELVSLMTNKLEGYKLLEPVRAYRDFVNDLSTWYLRRSRERIKDGDKEAKQTLYFVLRELSKLIAPFAPFYAEDLYEKLRVEKDPLSVHLENWPENNKSVFSFFKSSDRAVIKDMGTTAHATSLALELRSKANIKVRQPLSKLEIKTNLDSEYLEIIKDELNVKEVVINPSLEDEVRLDTTLTPELEEEGRLRDVIRQVQEWRKEQGLKPGERANYPISEEDKSLFAKYSEEIKKAANIEF